MLSPTSEGCRFGRLSPAATGTSPTGWRTLTEWENRLHHYPVTHNAPQPFSTGTHFKSMKVLDTNVSAQQSRKLLVCIIDQKKKKGPSHSTWTIPNASDESHWKAPFLGTWTSSEGTNHGWCTKQTGCKRPSVSHGGVQSKWSVIDRALLSDPWRHPKSKRNRAFPFSHTISTKLNYCWLQFQVSASL